MSEFVAFPKMRRYLGSEILVTEKIDGTNAQILITDEGEMRVGSRNRWITPQSDNFGFARWAEENKEELLKLGPGRHFGEWWGQGIQRGYGLSEKRFSLFNAIQWDDASTRPSCCHVVPILFRGTIETFKAHEVMDSLKLNGSEAARGFMNPEGCIVFFRDLGGALKYTFDARHKWEYENAIG